MHRFRVEVISKMHNPQQVVYAALHQDYSENLVFDDQSEWPSESKCGELIVKRLLRGDRGHFGPLEHPNIVFNCGYFPHSVMQQIRTHRVGISFDVQSNRYTGKRIIDVTEGSRDIEEVFYLRPVGFYSDRQGKRYEYTQQQRDRDLAWCLEAAKRYAQLIAEGAAEEHARGIIPFDVRQHWVMSLNARSLMHLLDLRAKPDAQLECQKLCELIFPHFSEWMPEIAQWYEKTRLKKARLSP
ncbi:MAG: FAD-dependent thymidylate synthase [Desertifilum sp. SIO1I2]|nr:FAD-dependent thymidylate synthase [Desertifilum sp. SIO1I2]